MARPSPEQLARREQDAGARLPYARHVDDATIELRDGMLMQVIHLAGLPFETSDTETLNYRKAVRDTMLRGIASSRFAIYHHVVRREVQPTVEGEFDDDFSRALDDAWKARLGAKKLYVNDLFLTLVRRPMAQFGWIDRVLRGLTGAANGPEAQVARAQDQRELDAARESLISALAPYGARLLTAYEGAKGQCSEPLEFLSSLFNGEMRPVLLPQSDLGQYLPYRRVSFGAEALELARSGALSRTFAAMALRPAANPALLVVIRDLS